MKIQFNGQKSFTLSNSKINIALDPESNTGKEIDFVALSTPKAETEQLAKKVLSLPGEFEISGVLAQGFFADNQESIVFKLIMEEISVVDFSGVKAVPETKFFEKLGENVDVILMALSEDFNEKDAKALIDKIDPRMVIFGGDASFYPKVVENLGAKVAETPTIKITRNGFSDDKTEIFVVNA